MYLLTRQVVFVESSKLHLSTMQVVFVSCSKMYLSTKLIRFVASSELNLLTGPGGGAGTSVERGDPNFLNFQLLPQIFSQN